MEIFSLDWQRIFIGTSNWSGTVEIVFRTTFLYLYTLLITRLVGRRRSLGKLTPLEFILVIVLGPAAGGGMIYPAIPLLQAVLVITTLGVLAKLGATLAHRSAIVHSFLEGEPLKVIQNGIILTSEIKKENITEADVLRELREEGYKDPTQIKEAYLEASGRMSFLPKEDKVN